MPSAVYAIHTFDFIRWYQSIRIGPNNWSLLATLVDMTTVGDGSGEAFSCSAGALTADLADKHGMVTYDNFNDIPYFIGNGLPTAPQVISVAGLTLTTSDYWDACYGAFWTNSAYYLCLVDFAGTQVHMIKTTDGGATWSEVDAAHAPTLDISNAGAGRTLQSTEGYFRDTNLNRLWLVGNSSGSSSIQDIYYFDMNSVSPNFETWVFHSSYNSGRKIWFGASVGIVAFSDGNPALIYGGLGGLGSGVFYSVYSGGAWSPEITVFSASNGAALANVLLEPSGTDIRVFYYHGSLGGTRNTQVHHVAVSEAGTVSNLFDFPAPVGNSDGVGHGMIFNGQIFVPYDDFNDKANSVWVSPLSGAANFIKELLPVPPAESGKNPSCAYLVFGTSPSTDFLGIATRRDSPRAIFVGGAGGIGG